MIVGTAAQRPVEFALRFFDGEIVDTSVAVMHDTVFVELPVFISVGAEPVARVVMTLIGEADRDASAVEGPEFFDEAVVEFALPFSREELDDFLTAVDELCTVSPFAIYVVTERDFFGIARVPVVFCFSYLCCCGFAGKWRD